MLYLMEVLAIILVICTVIGYPIGFLIYTALRVTGVIW